jgi:hypothetical protein
MIPKVTNENELKERLSQIVKEQFIEEWLDTPNPALDNKTPRQMVLEQNSDQIEMMLYRIGSGEPSG